MDGNPPMTGPPSHLQYTQNVFQISIVALLSTIAKHVEAKELIA